MCSIYEACASFRLAKFHYVFYCSFIVAPNALLSTSNYASCVYWNCIHGNVCLFEQKDRAALLEVRTWANTTQTESNMLWIDCIKANRAGKLILNTEKSCVPLCFSQWFRKINLAVCCHIVCTLLFESTVVTVAWQFETVACQAIRHS